MRNKLKILFSLLLALIIIFGFIQQTIFSQWIQQSLPFSGNILDIAFLNKDTGYIAFNENKLYRTINGGNNWSLVNNFRFRLIECPDNNTLYALPWDANKLYRSYDAGFTWDSVSIPSILFNNISFISKDTGWICTNTGICKTTNGGSTLLLLTSQFASDFADVKIKMFKKYYNGSNFGYVWKGGANYGLYKTTNSGFNWSLSYLHPYIQDIFILHNDTSWMSVTSPLGVSKILKTNNSGNNWSEQIVNYDLFFSKLCFTDVNKGWCGAYDSSANYSILTTSNGGANWGYQLLPINSSLKSVFINSMTGWVSSGSQIAKTTNGGGNIIAVEIINTILPTYYHLFQNYPNPFNPATKINYDLPKDSKVTMTVYDILGREVIKLVNGEFKKAGRYVVNFNGVNLASGVYFYRLEAGEFVQSKKMVLVK